VFISSGTGGHVYRSTDFGANWETITIGTGLGAIPSIVVNSVGQYVFAAVTNIGIFRSYDFGATFQQINSSETQWLNISCSATAQFVIATRSGQTYALSDDYGTTWSFGAENFVDAAMCIDEIADATGRKAEVAAITEAAMRGEITDFRESLRRQ